ncbi:MAG TPA: hypothetical protein VLM20_01925 [Methylophilaceae bacterium]|nr:hypothetical protein [Methylophilaceae bacterium]
MKLNFDLDFATQCKPYSRFLVLIIAGCLCFLLVVMIYHLQQLKSELNIKSKNSEENFQPSKKKLSPSLQQSFKLAHQTQAELNVPWEAMLISLENAQAAVPQMRLLSIQPDPKKAVIVMTGVVDEFSVLADYIDIIKSQPTITDAVLQRQQWGEAPDNEVRLNFILVLGWKL